MASVDYEEARAQWLSQVSAIITLYPEWLGDTILATQRGVMARIARDQELLAQRTAALSYTFDASRSRLSKDRFAFVAPIVAEAFVGTPYGANIELALEARESKPETPLTTRKAAGSGKKA